MICNYYVTLSCNATCEFCPLWVESEKNNLSESGNFKQILLSLKREGVHELNITGGEPLLRDDLPELLAQAKEFGFKVKLTTNGILYADKARALQGLVDNLYFSLDYPFADEHDRSRGVDCFHLVIQGINLAQQLKQKPIINFTMTRDNVRFLPEMVDLAEKLGVFIYLNPVYDFHGSQGFEGVTLFHIHYYARRRKVLVNYAALEFVKQGGNKVIFPRCRASQTSITVLPDGKRVSPCFFNQEGRQGREDICSSCMRWPYMLPSFSKGIDKYFFLNLYSKFDMLKKGVKK
ncbi:MAG: radical SAM protein [Candidatus Saganbacteria bacterium]|nr:radical SAM protein [Candidatus Saganbacteria bacterium]